MIGSVTPVILSGGSGTRLWPYSRAKYPKQLLLLAGERTMLQETLLRVGGIAAKQNSPIVVCNEEHRFLVAQQLQEIGVEARIVLEPEGRNTAPAACLAALCEEGKADGTALLFLPADHVIRKERALIDAINRAVDAAGAFGSLVAFGVVPDAPHTGYGYIRAGERIGTDARRIAEFVEKPDLADATGYVESGEYLWNSGMFLFPVDVFLRTAKEFAPDIFESTKSAMSGALVGEDFIRPVTDSFLGCRSASIDYALMEHADNTLVVPLDAGWSDVGSWSALKQVLKADGANNVLRGDVTAIDCEGCYISSESRLVAAVGLAESIVVETQDAVLVTTMEKAEAVKDIVASLREQERPEVALHRTVYRPWGNYDSVDSGAGFQVKRLIVNPGAVLSLQMHHHRAEHWVVVKGKARITRGEEEFDLDVNESTYIRIGEKHRIANPYSEPVHIIEVQSGDYLGEDDIVRFEDEYGREGTNT